MLPALFADTATHTPEVLTFWESLARGSILTLVYGILGILLLALGFKVFDWLTPRLDIEKELSEKQNLAVAIISGAVIIGVAVIIATVTR